MTKGEQMVQDMIESQIAGLVAELKEDGIDAFDSNGILNILGTAGNAAASRRIGALEALRKLSNTVKRAHGRKGVR